MEVHKTALAREADRPRTPRRPRRLPVTVVHRQARHLSPRQARAPWQRVSRKPAGDGQTGGSPAVSPDGGQPGTQTGGAQTGQTAVRGDVNGDGTVTILDVTLIQRHLLGIETLSGSSLTAADVDGNGSIDVADVITIQRDILGIQ